MLKKLLMILSQMVLKNMLLIFCTLLGKNFVCIFKFMVILYNWIDNNLAEHLINRCRERPLCRSSLKQ